MKKQPKILNLSVILFASVTALFLLFFLYVNHYERIDLYQARETRSYAPIETYTLEQITDETAPAGVRNVYHWTQQIQDHNDTCLTILTVHQSVQVYFGDELVYSMEPSEKTGLPAAREPIGIPFPSTPQTTVSKSPSL